MRGRAISWVVMLALTGAAGLGSAATAAKAKQAPKRPAARAGGLQEVKLRVGELGPTGMAPARELAEQGPALVVNGLPLAGAKFAVRSLRIDRQVASLAGTADGELALDRPEATVRVKPGVKEMRVDGQRVPLRTAAMVYKGSVYLPVEVLQAAYPDCQITLTYQAASKTVLLAYRPKATSLTPAARPGPAVQVAATPRPQAAPAPVSAGSATCAPSSGGAGVATQEFGQKGAKLEIVALLPITHGCHVRTESELKKAYEQHPKDIHLTIVDLFGSEAPKYLSQVGGGMGAVVAINGKTSFTLSGQSVTLRRQEGGLYQPSQIGPITEQELKAT